MTDPLVGRRLGEFTLIEAIGSGASGVVYRAEQQLLQREAAVKVLVAPEPEAIAAFLKEARLASGLDHPYAAHIYGFGAEPDHVLWFAMELVRGTTLDRWVADRGPMAAERFLSLLERICEVVQTAHDKGIVHRDLKPANVMVLSRAGRLLPKLLDFGIARAALAEALPRASADAIEAIENNPVLAAVPEALRADVTHRGIVGSPAFMAPEQWLDPSKADARTDQYAFGVLCFAVLTGQLPFRGGALMEIAKQHARAPVPSLGEHAPKALDTVLARAMAKRRDERYDSLLDFAAAFRDAIGVPAEAESLPQLDQSVRDALALTAPQPIAEAVTALEGARDVAHATKAAECVLEVTAQYCALVALSGLLHVPQTRRPKSELVEQRLAALAGERLPAAGWLDIACEIAAGFRNEPGVFPIPELVVALGDPGFPRPASPAGDLAALVGDLSRMLAKLAWISDYRVAHVRRRALEVWTGTRRSQRGIGHAAKDAVDGSLVLLDGDNTAVLTLSPLVQIARPSPGMAEEMFLFDGADQRGPRLRTQPVVFDRHDPDLKEWSRANGLNLGLVASAEVAKEQAPYRGLATFTRDDAGWFFGREREIEAFGNRLRVQALLAVVGPSGAGKSSFVQAGVLASLPEGSESVTVRPGATPIAELAAKLARAGIAVERERLAADPTVLDTALRAHASASGHTFVLVVDQFEELFTLGAPPAERQAYSAALAAVGDGDDGKVRVIFTLRDDFLVRTEQLPALRHRLAQGMELLATPAPEDLHHILVEPARRVGYQFEDDGLVDDMVQAVAEQPGALPLLSFTASRLWELRDVRYHRLTRRSYQTLGGVVGALAKHADETIEALPEDQQPLVREIFRHLVTSEGTRAVLEKHEATQLLGGGTRADSVLEKLVGSRLVVASEGEAGHERIEVAHEALINAWPRLVRWRQEDAEIVRVRDQLRASARQWAERERPRGLLWRDEVLAEYRLWRTRYTGALTELEQQFARASVEQADRAQRRRRVVLSSAFVVLAAGAIAMTLLGLNASRNAADAKRLLVDSYFEQARTALLDGRDVTALDYIHRAHDAGLRSPALGLMAAYARPSVESEIARMDDHGGRVRNLRYSPDGSRIYSAYDDGAIRVWDSARHTLLATWTGHKAIVRRLVVSRDGRWLASSSDDGVTNIWDTATGRVIARHSGPDGQTYCLDLDMELGLVVAGGIGSLWIGDPRTGRTLKELKFDGVSYGCPLDSKGRWVVTGNTFGGTAAVWDVATGQRLLALANGPSVNDMALSLDGTLLATASSDGNARLWSLPDGRLLQTISGHGSSVLGVLLSPDGKRLVSTGRDLTARVWDVETGAAMLTLPHRDEINGLQFDPSGDHLATTSRDGTVRLWDLTTGRLVKIVSGSEAPIVSPQFSPDGNTVAAGSWDGWLAMWPTGDPFHVETWSGETKECESDNRPNRQVAIVTCPHFTHVWDLQTQQKIELPAAEAGAVADDGSYAATYANGVLTAWNLKTKVAQNHVELPEPPTVLEWSSTRDRVAVGTVGGQVLVWNIGGQGPPQLIHRHPTMVSALAWSQSGLVVTGDAQGGVCVSRGDSDRVATPAFWLRGIIAFVRFSHDSSMIGIAAGSSIEVHDTASLQTFARLQHGGDVITFDFDRRDQRIISGATDNLARVWRSRDGSLLSRLTGATSWVVWPEFVGDTLAAATGNDGIVRVWDIERAKQILVLPGSRTPGRAIIHTDPDRYLLQSADGSLMSWSIPSQ